MGKSNVDNIGAIVRTVINICVNILVLAIVAMLTITYAGKAYDFGRAIFDEKAIDTVENAKNVVVTIPKGASNKEIAKIVEEEGLIENKYVFMIQLMLSDYKDTIEPGTYTVTTANTPTEIMQVLSKMVEEETEK